MISEAGRRIKILEYVQRSSEKGEKITKSDVMRHLKKDSRMMTTHKSTIELIKEGKIKMTKPKDKPYSQTDYLVINDKNEFIKTIQDLPELEKAIEKVVIAKPKKPLDVPTEDLIIWKILLKLAFINKFPSEDREILYRKCMKLLVELALKKLRSIKETKE